ncbi:MAG: hypothetical protein HY720_10480 [Planctomycetes bacterium]|nr:hypothetical protein [Planctomycetota bacterium]
MATRRPGDIATPGAEAVPEVELPSPAAPVVGAISPPLQGDLATERHVATAPPLQAAPVAVPRTVALSPRPHGDLATPRQGAAPTSRHVALATSLPEPGGSGAATGGDMSPSLHVATSPGEAPQVRLIKKDFYLTPEQDLQIDRICMEAKERTGRNIARSDVVREALALYFVQRTRR